MFAFAAHKVYPDEKITITPRDIYDNIIVSYVIHNFLVADLVRETYNIKKQKN